MKKNKVSIELSKVNSRGQCVWTFKNNKNEVVYMETFSAEDFE